MALIYCVEDDEGIRELITCALQSGGYTAISFDTGKALYAELKTNKPDLIILDIMLPDVDGLTVLKTLKSEPLYADLPVIMLTAKTTEIDKVQGLEAGADDYITKPFGVMELLSRIKAVLRRVVKQVPIPEVILISGLSLDISKRVVMYNNTEVVLTYKEFELLAYLMKHKSIAVNRDKLMEKVWGFNYEGESRTVDMHIKTLRQKLEAAGCVDMIKTIRGVGYKI
ncbi:MAG: response regulator transcription factor [Clostridiales bacterium]|nr:response regulator transcription factor [Clostridiales bacterium]